MRILFAATALAAVGFAGAAQAEDADLAALKAQIQLLQARIDVLERQSSVRTAPPISAAPVAPAPSTASAPKPAPEPIRWRFHLTPDWIARNVPRPQKFRPYARALKPTEAYALKPLEPWEYGFLGLTRPGSRRKS